MRKDEFEKFKKEFDDFLNRFKNQSIADNLKHSIALDEFIKNIERDLNNLKELINNWIDTEIEMLYERFNKERNE